MQYKTKDELIAFLTNNWKNGQPMDENNYDTTWDAIVNSLWPNNNGGTDSFGVKSQTINANGDTEITFSDNTVVTVKKGADGAQGVQGAQGADGAQGAQGAQGVQGVQGTQGPAGKDGNGISIKGTVDDASKLPSSGNTAGDAYLVNGDLYVWTGSQWNDAGKIQGPAGKDGAQGPAGKDGKDGAKGDTGPAGTAGVNGKRGTQIYYYNGDASAEYNSILCQNVLPANSVPSANDKLLDSVGNMYNITQGDFVILSFDPSSKISLKGKDGEQGPQGLQGAQGIQGPAGQDGAQGTQGIQGPAGKDGAQGAQGAQGQKGDTGTIGTRGFSVYTSTAAIDANGKLALATLMPTAPAPLLGDKVVDSLGNAYVVTAVSSNDVTVDPKSKIALSTSFPIPLSDPIYQDANGQDRAAFSTDSKMQLLNFKAPATTTDADGKTHSFELLLRSNAVFHNLFVDKSLANVPNGQNGALVPYGMDMKVAAGLFYNADESANDKGAICFGDKSDTVSCSVNIGSLVPAQNASWDASSILHAQTLNDIGLISHDNLAVLKNAILVSRPSYIPVDVQFIDKNGKVISPASVANENADNTASAVIELDTVALSGTNMNVVKIPGTSYYRKDFNVNNSPEIKLLISLRSPDQDESFLPWPDGASYAKVVNGIGTQKDMDTVIETGASTLDIVSGDFINMSLGESYFEPSVVLGGNK